MALTIAELRVSLSADTAAFKAGMNNAVSTSKAAAQQAGDAWRDASGRLRDAQGKFVAEASRGAERAGYALQNIGSSATQAGMKILSSFTESVKASAQFSQALANVDSIAKLTPRGMQDLHQSILRLASDPKIRQMPVDLAKGMYDVVSSGFSGKKALEVLREGAYGASAGMTSTSTATKVLMAVLNSGIGGVHNAKQAMNVLFREVDLGVNSFEELATSMGPVIPNAKMLGVTLQDVAAAQVVMTRQGINLARTNTSLGSLFAKIVAPTGPMIDAFEQVGIKYGSAALKGRTYTDWLVEAKAKMEAFAATHNSIQIGKRQFAITGTDDLMKRLFPDVRAMQGFAVTVKNLDLFKEALKGMKTANDGVGASTAALDRQNKGAIATWERFTKQLQVAQIAIGDALAPGLTRLLGIISQAVESFTKLPQPVRDFLVVGTALSGVSLVLAGHFLSLTGSLAVMAANWGGVTTIATALSTVLTGPVGIALVGVTAAVLGLAAAWRTNFGGIRTETLAFVNAVKPPLLGLWSDIKAFGGAAFGFLKGLFIEIGPIVQTYWNGTWQVIAGVFKIALAGVTTTLRLFVALMHGDWRRAMSAVVDGARLGWDGVKSIFGGWGRWIESWFRTIVGVFGKSGQDLIDGLVNGVKSRFANAKKAITDFGQGIVDTVKTTLGIRSPSVVFHSLGEMTVEGFVAGMKSKHAHAKHAARQVMSEAAKEAKSFAAEIAKSRAELATTEAGGDNDKAGIARRFRAISAARREELVAINARIQAIKDERDSTHRLNDTLEKTNAEIRALKSGSELEVFSLGYKGADPARIAQAYNAEQTREALKEQMQDKARAAKEMTRELESMRLEMLKGNAVTLEQKAALEKLKQPYDELSKSEQEFIRNYVQGKVELENYTRSIKENQKAAEDRLKSMSKGALDSLNPQIVGKTDIGGRSHSDDLNMQDTFGMAKTRFVLAKNKDDDPAETRWKKHREGAKALAEEFNARMNAAFNNLTNGNMKNFFGSLMNQIGSMFKSIGQQFLQQVMQAIALWATNQMFGKAAGAGISGPNGLPGGMLNTALSFLPGGGAIGGILGGVKKLFHFADGGIPPIGVPSLVGERGPELFVPSSAGRIIPNHALGAPQNVTVTNQFYGPISHEADENRLTGKINGDVQKALRLAF